VSGKVRNDPITVSPCAEPPPGVEVGEFEGLLDVRIPGSVEEVGPAVERIMEQVRDQGCARDHEFEIEVALLEALGNAVEHGCGDDPSKEVEVWVGCHDEYGLVVIVRDPGPGFDPSLLPNPVEGENLLKTHGRGVWLINQLMDSVHFSNGGTELWMHKRPKNDCCE
jgi:serine/threonine-protein kinase RsbW